MTKRELRDKLQNLSGVKDFFIFVLDKYNPKYWGLYYPPVKMIVIYKLKENGKPIGENMLVKTCLHELAHHIQFHHVKNYKVKSRHDEMFKKIYADLLVKYYKGNIPRDIMAEIKKYGLFLEPFKSLKK
ncbi:MAG: hypothetical protein GX196_01990 [Clostridiaceae bacterium]|nr:hypothetical protein [Clostridiaceae bacterium]